MKWIITFLLLLVALMSGLLFHKESRIKQSLDHLDGVREKLRNVNTKLDHALLLNQNLATSNIAFQQKVKALDSLLKIKNHEWQEKEQYLLTKLNENTKLMEVWRHQLEATEAHLPKLPVRQLFTIEKNLKSSEQ